MQRSFSKPLHFIKSGIIYQYSEKSLQKLQKLTHKYAINKLKWNSKHSFKTGYIQKRVIRPSVKNKTNYKQTNKAKHQCINSCFTYTLWKYIQDKEYNKD